MNRGLTQYLQHYAEPEATIGEAVRGPFSAALVAPLHREHPRCVEAYSAALEECSSTPLLILVLNSAESVSVAAQRSTQELLRALVARTAASEYELLARTGSARYYVGRLGQAAVLIVDRCSPGKLLPKKAGAGLARKIGNDIAVALYQHGSLTSRVVFQTDGDVTLPPDLFAALPQIEPHAGPSPVAAWVLPFLHEPGDDPAEYIATLHYEVRLRYYVAGLRYAESSYAWHSLGSAIAIELFNYAAVRGFPKRPAAEDFYLLDKLSKLGSIESYSCSPIRIRARSSDRVPFGTGPAVQKLLSGSSELHDFRIFEVLKRCNFALTRLANGAGFPELRDAFISAPGFAAADPQSVLEQWRVSQAAWNSLGLQVALQRAITGAPVGPIRARRIRDCFDGLKTLRYLHWIRDELYPDLPFWQALAEAPPFFNFSGLDRGSELSALERVRDMFFDERWIAGHKANCDDQLVSGTHEPGTSRPPRPPQTV